MEYKEQDSHALVVQLRRKLWIIIVFLLAIFFALAFLTAAWFVSNQRTNAQGMEIQSEQPEYLKIGDSVTATRHYLSPREDLVISMTRMEDGLLEPIPPEGDAVTEASVLFDSMLPGEWVDITFDVTMDPAAEQNAYCVYLADFRIGPKPETAEAAEESSGWFALDDDGGNPCFYNVLGVYTYQLRDVSIKETGEALLAQMPDAEFLGQYTANRDDDIAPTQIPIYTGQWEMQGRTVSVTLRFGVDFSQFYALIRQTGSNISNLLSQKGFMLRRIGVAAVE